jgi:hypothetical protein
MPAQYKRKRLIEEQCIDKKPTAIRKQLNSSERIRGKVEARTQLENSFLSKTEIQSIRWDIEMSQSIECHNKEKYGVHKHIENILEKLDVGEFYLYKCTCKNYDDLSDKEILDKARSGEI